MESNSQAISFSLSGEDSNENMVLLTPSSSFASDSDSDSDSSSCAKGSQPVSSLGKVQQSTVDTHNFDSNVRISSRSNVMLSSSSRLSELSTCRGQISSSGNSKSSSDMRNLSKHRFGSSGTLMKPVGKKKARGNSGIPAIFEETFTKYVSLHRVADEFARNLRMVFDSVEAAIGNVFGVILSTLFPVNPINQSREPMFANQDQCEYSSRPPEALNQEFYDELQPDDLLSPAKVTHAPSSNNKDDWGHFADFEEELADEAITATIFICNSKSFLATLEEGEEEIEDEVRSILYQVAIKHATQLL
jgi:hypothetical protein